MVSSEKLEKVQDISLKWNEPTDVLRLRVPYDPETMALWARSIAREQSPPISDHSRAFLLYVIRAVVKLDEFRDVVLSEEYPEIKRIEACIRTEVARDIFELPPEELHEIEPGWVLVGSREIGQ